MFPVVSFCSSRFPFALGAQAWPPKPEDLDCLAQLPIDLYVKVCHDPLGCSVDFGKGHCLGSTRWHQITLAPNMKTHNVWKCLWSMTHLPVLDDQCNVPNTSHALVASFCVNARLHKRELPQTWHFMNARCNSNRECKRCPHCRFFHIFACMIDGHNHYSQN